MPAADAGSEDGDPEPLRVDVVSSNMQEVVGGELFRDLLRSNSLGDRAETRGAVFAEAVLGGGRKGVLSAGLRQDWHEGFGWFLSPSLGGSYRIGPSLRFRSSAGRSFRAPTWTERLSTSDFPGAAALASYLETLQGFGGVPPTYTGGEGRVAMCLSSDQASCPKA